MTAGLTLVTGGAGFLGQHVVSALTARDMPVRVLDIRAGGADAATSGGCAVEWVRGSVTDEDVVAASMKGVDAVIHLAANPYLWARSACEFDVVNHQGTRTVLAAARKADLQAFVHVSSLTTRIAGRAGHAEHEERQVKETYIPDLSDMLGAYPRSKWLAEDAARKARADGLPVRIAIPTMPLGPGDRSLTPPTRMVLDYVSGTTPASVESWMNVADVRDMAAWLVALLDKETPPEGVFLGGDNIRLSSLLRRLEATSGVAMPRRQVPGWAAEGYAHVDEFLSARVTNRMPKAPVTGVKIARRPVTFDLSLAQALLPRRQFTLDATLCDLLSWFDEHGYWTRTVDTLKSSCGPSSVRQIPVHDVVQTPGLRRHI